MDLSQVDDFFRKIKRYVYATVYESRSWARREEEPGAQENAQQRISITVFSYPKRKEKDGGGHTIS